jgi:hypothetical protein
MLPIGVFTNPKEILVLDPSRIQSPCCCLDKSNVPRREENDATPDACEKSSETEVAAAPNFCIDSIFHYDNLPF